MPVIPRKHVFKVSEAFASESLETLESCFLGTDNNHEQLTFSVKNGKKDSNVQLVILDV